MFIIVIWNILLRLYKPWETIMGYYLYFPGKHLYKYQKQDDIVLCKFKSTGLLKRKVSVKDNRYGVCRYADGSPLHSCFLIVNMKEDDVLLFSLKGTRLIKLPDNANETRIVNGTESGSWVQLLEYINIDIGLEED